MKLTFVLLTAVALQVSAKGTAQTITFFGKDVPLERVFSIIKQQTGYVFMYKAPVLQSSKPVSISAENVPLEKFLSEIFSSQPLKYNIKGKSIFISRKKSQSFDRQLTTSVPDVSLLEDILIPIRGRVVNENGEPVASATVMVKGTKEGTVTDSSGEFQLRDVRKDATIVISLIGFQTREIRLNGQSRIDVQLVRSLSNLDEVVVMAYGSQKKATVTGSIATVDGNTLKRAPANSLSNALAGRLPGLVAVNPSGEPGLDGSVLRIRGNNTLGDNSALIVVDGIILNSSFDRIDQSDVESITILKDASAAIYGAQAANGVILVKTKRGIRGKLKVDFTHNEGWVSPTVIPKMADAATFTTILNELDEYRNRAPRYSAEDIQKYADGSDPWKYANTDWYGEVYKKHASQRYDNISIRGGSENLNYFVSGGYKYHGAIYKNSPVDFSQFNFRSNVDAKLSKNVRLGLDLTGLSEDADYVGTATGDIFYGILKGLPNMPAFWPNGLPGPDVEYGMNPAIIPSGITGYNRHKTSSLQTNARLEINVPWVKGLSITANAAHFSRFYNLKNWRQPWELYYWDYQTYDANNEPLLVKAKVGIADPRLTQTSERNTSLTLNARVDYEREFAGAHYLKLMVGSERIKGDASSFWASRRYFVSTSLQQLFAGGDLEKDNSGTASANARLNYFGRFNYNYKQKYLLEVLGRYDGSYIFPENRRFGFFPGVSVGWQASSEEFWKNNLSAVNFFKLRASWGQTGNDRISEYQYISSYGFGSSSYIFNVTREDKYISELRIPNKNVTWEVANQANIGVDGQMLNGKITFSAEYFHNVRTDILVTRNASVPASTGLTLPPENIGKVSNRGFEVQLGYNNQVGDFKYSVSGNINYAKNRIDFWDESGNVPEYQKSTGHPMGSNLYYNAIGIFRDEAHVESMPHWGGARPGDIIFEDVNKDGLINGLDRVRYFRSTTPTWTGGLSVSLEYKNFYLSVLLQGAAGAHQVHYVPSGDLWGNYLSDDVDDRWTENNKDASKPRAWNRIDEYWMSEPGQDPTGVNNSFFLRNNDYLRLRNTEAGFNMPRSITSKLGVDNVRIYFSGLNLVTFSGLKDSDPEMEQFYAYPISKVYNVGINLTF